MIFASRAISSICFGTLSKILERILSLGPDSDDGFGVPLVSVPVIAGAERCGTGDWGQRIRGRISSKISSTPSTSLAPCLRRRCVPVLRMLRATPGTAKTSRPCSRAKRAVISDPLLSAASTTTTPSARPLIMRFLDGKLPGDGGAPGGNSVRSAPVRAISSPQVRVGGRIVHVQPAAQDRQCPSAGFERPAVGGGVDAERKAAYHRNTAEGQIGGQFLSEYDAGGRGQPRAHHGNGDKVPRLKGAR